MTRDDVLCLLALVGCRVRAEVLHARVSTLELTDGTTIRVDGGMPHVASSGADGDLLAVLLGVSFGLRARRGVRRP